MKTENTITKKTTVLAGIALISSFAIMTVILALPNRTEATYIRIGELNAEKALNSTEWHRLEGIQTDLHTKNVSIDTQLVELQESVFKPNLQ